MSRSSIFQARLSKDPNNPLFHYSYGQALFEEGRYRDCIEHLEFCNASREDWMMPRILLGKAYLELEEAGKARPLLETALTLSIDQHHEGPEAEIRELLADL